MSQTATLTFNLNDGRRYPVTITLPETIQGPQGLIGPQGEQGVPGIEGPQGPMGPVAPPIAGVPMPWPLDTPPDNCLLMNGASFNKDQFPQLAKAYPTGNLPDLRGLFIRGLDPTGKVDNYLGGSRKPLSFEEGSFICVGDCEENDSSTFTGLGSNSGPDYINMLARYNYDAPSDLSTPTPNTAPNKTYSQSNTQPLGIPRPKNIAFNYITYAA